MRLRTIQFLIAFTGVASTLGGWYFDAIKKPATHLFNPHWLPHARYHSALWLFSITLACAASLLVLRGNYIGRDSQLAIWMAAFLSGLFYLSFFPLLLFRNAPVWDNRETPFMPIAPPLLVAIGMVLLLTDGCTMAGYAPAGAGVSVHRV